MAADTMARRVQLPAKWIMALVLFAACLSGKKKTDELSWYNEKDISLQNDGGLFRLNGQPFSGVVFRLADNNKDTILVGSFRHGSEDGEWRKYYPNHQLMERRYYSAGKKSGTYEGWWPDGKPRLLYHFSEGEYEGNCRDWSDNGTLVSNMNYRKGYEDGLQQQFYETGKVKANYMMIDGRRYGLLGTKNCVNVSDSIFKK